jgi:hypothetical protein
MGTCFVKVFLNFLASDIWPELSKVTSMKWFNFDSKEASKSEKHSSIQYLNTLQTRSLIMLPGAAFPSLAEPIPELNL